MYKKELFLRDEEQTERVNLLFNSIVKQSGGSYNLSVQQLDCDMMQEIGKQSYVCG